MKTLFLYAFLFFCLNTYDQIANHEKNFPRYGSASRRFYWSINNESETFEKKLAELKENKDFNNSVEIKTEYALALVYSKRFVEAKEIFEKIELERPNTYINASNLGTVLELLGQDTEALRLIKRALEIEPDAHEGTEWLHELILEKKIEKYDSCKSIFDLDFGYMPIPKVQSHDPKFDDKNILYALTYQLNERLKFVKPENKMIASMLHDLSFLFATKGDYSEALEINKYALQYGYKNSFFDLFRYGFFRLILLLWPESFVFVISLFFGVSMTLGGSIIVFQEFLRIIKKKR